MSPSPTLPAFIPAGSARRSSRREPAPSGRTSLRTGLLAALLVAGLAACGSDGATGSGGTTISGVGGGGATSAVLVVDDAGTSTFSASNLDAQLALLATQPLSTAEKQGLASIREEDRLAHDVYAKSALAWPLVPIFANIASSESTHTAAVKSLLDRYGLPDPLAGLAQGVFATPAFQTLYDDLVTASATSLIAALQVGVRIEELDIRDIEAQKTSVDNADILLVYDNLLRGSRNHLRAFVKVLTQQGGTYTPQYITQAAFDAIVSSPVETGG